MTSVRCPRQRCVHWVGGWCQSDAVELAPDTLACMTYESVAGRRSRMGGRYGEIEWDDEEELLDEELDVILYGEDSSVEAMNEYDLDTAELDLLDGEEEWNR